MISNMTNKKMFQIMLLYDNKCISFNIAYINSKEHSKAIVYTAL